MKRFATLALAAIFALSFTANVAAAPEFSGKFTVENELALGGDINVGGDGPDLTFTLSAGEEGVWSLEVDLGSALMTEDATKLLVVGDAPGNPVALVSHEVTVGSGTYYKDPAGNYYREDGTKVESKADKASIDREIANDPDAEWEAVEDAIYEESYTGLELGAYKLSITPGPFALTVAGNEQVLQTKDRFEFIASTEKPTDPKFQLKTDIAGVGLTAEYETAGEDKFFAFATVPVAGVGEFGAALKVDGIEKDEPATQFSVDVASDALGFATLKAGLAFDLSAEDGKDSLAFAVGAEAPVIEGLTVNAQYKNDGRNKASDEHVQTISAGVNYNEDTVTASVAYRTDESEKPRLTVKGAVNYPVIADVFTVKASFESITDEDSALDATDPYAYKWNGVPVADILYGLLTVDASAEYAVTDAFTVTPSIKYQKFTLQTSPTDENTKGEGSITTFGVSGTYKFSDAASFTVGLEKASGDAVADKADTPIMPEVDTTKLTTAITVSF